MAHGGLETHARRFILTDSNLSNQEVAEKLNAASYGDGEHMGIPKICFFNSDGQMFGFRENDEEIIVLLVFPYYLTLAEGIGEQIQVAATV